MAILKDVIEGLFDLAMVSFKLASYVDPRTTEKQAALGSKGQTQTTEPTQFSKVCYANLDSVFSTKKLFAVIIYCAKPREWN